MWGAWTITDCPATCNTNANSTRLRDCNDPFPSNNGAFCELSSGNMTSLREMITIPCGPDPCPGMY